MSILKLASKFITNQSGSTAIEYALLGALLGMAALLAFSTLGNGLGNLFGATSNTVGNSLTDAGGAL